MGISGITIIYCKFLMFIIWFYTKQTNIFAPSAKLIGDSNLSSPFIALLQTWMRHFTWTMKVQKWWNINRRDIFISAFILYYLVCLITGLPSSYTPRDKMSWFSCYKEQQNILAHNLDMLSFSHNLCISRKVFDFLFWWMYCLH